MSDDERYEHILAVLRGAVQVEDSTGSVRVKASLLGEVADLLVMMDGDIRTPTFTNKTEKFRYHLHQSHIHAQRAYDQLFDPDGPKRSYFTRSAIGKAQNILITAFVREMKRKHKEEEEE